MTMHEPSSRVVCWESNHKPATSGKHSDVPSGRVVEVQSADGRVTKSAAPSAQDIEIVAMEMDRMGNINDTANGLLNHPVGPL